MAKKKKVSHRSILTVAALFFVPIFCVLLVRVVLPHKAAIQSITFPKAAATPKPINVLEIRYFPHNPVSQNAQTQVLSDGLVTAMSDSSMFHGYKDGAAVRYSSVDLKRTIERDRNSPFTTGQYSNSYHSMDTMLTADGENLCDYIVNNNIDQVWFWKDVGDGTADSGGFIQEYMRIWSSAVFPVQSPPPLCGGRRSFLVLGLDQDRAVAEALHSFGHSTESLISSIEGSDLFWTRYTGPSHNICGNVHFPPNGIADYDYAISTASATTSCEDWHPDGSGATTSVNCNRWSCLQTNYLEWWFQNMPNDGNTLTYSGKTLPNWWDFQSDTDTAVINALNLDQYTSPYFLDSYRPSYIDSVAGAAQQSGTSISFTQTVSGSNRVFMLGSSYRSPSKSTTVSGNEQITAVTIGATPLTRVTRTIFHEYTTELWYAVAPPLGTNTVTVTYASGVQDEAVAGVSFIGIDQVTPFDTNTGHQAGIATNASDPTISIPSTTSQVLFGVVSMYTGSSNDLGVSGSSHGIWGMHTTNVISKGAVATGGPSANISWTSLVSWPWSISAVALNVIQATPTPSPSPTAVPTSTPSMSCNSQCTSSDQCPSDLTCASGLCRRPGCTALDSCNCGPSCNSSCNQNSDCPSDLICDNHLCRRPGCTALDSCECGTSPTSTPTPIPASFSKKVTTVKSKVPFVNIKANGADILNIYPSASVLLSWTSGNVTSCVTGGAWYGRTLLSGTMKTPVIFTSTQYSIKCTGLYGTVSDVVNLTSHPPTVKK